MIPQSRFQRRAPEILLFLSLFIMQPVMSEIDQKALQPYLNKQMSGQEAVRIGLDIHKRFLLRHTRKQDLALFLHLAGNTDQAGAAGGER